jgi:branched-chain amino acid transport system permease protein
MVDCSSIVIGEPNRFLTIRSNRCACQNQNILGSHKGAIGSSAPCGLHGSMMVLGAYITYTLTTRLGIDPFLTLPVSAAALFVLGYFLQLLLINRVVQASVFLTLILTFGVDMVLTNMHVAVFSADVRTVNPPYAGEGLMVAGIQLPYTRMAVFGIAIALTVALAVFLRHTRTGNAIEATSFDREAAQLAGVNTPRIYATTLGIGVLMAGVAGSLIAVVFTFSPASAIAFTTKSFVVVVLGGLGSVPGAIVGGIVLGVAENVASLTLDPGYRNAVGFLLVLVVLIWLRRGIFGKPFYAQI